MFENKKTGYAIIGIAALLIVLLTAIKIDNDSKSTVLCEKFYETDHDMKECPVHKSSFSWVIILAYVIVFAMLGLGGYIAYIPAKTEKHFKNIDISTLDDEEKMVYELIKAKQGSAYQGELIKETQWGKVKISRILDKLESKEILERKRRGMTNIIVLK
ncbi:hypothetical protein HY486_03760 [Candidatus Woesearchaeota archaeon]|nr:hypothetical protein [Candidatus Woesearchaeota archaeon]